MFAALPNRYYLPIFSSNSCNAVDVSLPKMADTRGVAALSTNLDEVEGCAALLAGLLGAPVVSEECAAVTGTAGEGSSAMVPVGGLSSIPNTLTTTRS